MADGDIQARIVLGKSAIGRVRLSTDRKWLAMEQHPSTNDLLMAFPTRSSTSAYMKWS
jgi:hypothetical protein